MSTNARVTVTLEINVNSTWGDTCSFGQVRDQAIQEAEGLLRRAFQSEHAVGDMKVLAIYHPVAP